jgi:hypothetical protein
MKKTKLLILSVTAILTLMFCSSEKPGATTPRE